MDHIPVNLSNVPIVVPSAPILPALAGPQLGPFVDPNAPGLPLQINIVSMIGEGLHAYVFKANINGFPYCLKIFKFHDMETNFFNDIRHVPLTAAEIADNAHEKLITPTVNLHRQMDPFYRECRAYGRLKETGMERLAHKCHGHLFFNNATEAILNRLLPRINWERSPIMHARWPLRVLVKDLIVPNPRLKSGHQAFKHHRIWHMMNDLQDMHTIGIVHCNIKADNYLKGKLIDFSSSLTTPHVRLDPAVYQKLLAVNLITNNDVLTGVSEARLDMEDFDVMLDDWEVNDERCISEGDDPFYMRFFPGSYNGGTHFSSMLRPRHTHQVLINRPRPVFNPVLYDWANMTRNESRE